MPFLSLETQAAVMIVVKRKLHAFLESLISFYIISSLSLIEF